MRTGPHPAQQLSRVGIYAGEGGRTHRNLGFSSTLPGRGVVQAIPGVKETSDVSLSEVYQAESGHVDPAVSVVIQLHLRDPLKNCKIDLYNVIL